MTVIKADFSATAEVKRITEQTILEIYPRYYPRGAVEYFLRHHSEERISTDIAAGIVYLLTDGGKAVGTVTVRENEICRLFVLPSEQGKGYGRALLDFAEGLIGEKYGEITLAASLPAKNIYLKRGYAEVAFDSICTDGGDFLCYDTMVKRLK